MKLYARARRPDGGLIRMSYPGDGGPEPAVDPAGDRAEGNARPDRHTGAPVEDGLSWWERWGMLGALEPSAYQRLF